MREDARLCHRFQDHRLRGIEVGRPVVAPVFVHSLFGHGEVGPGHSGETGIPGGLFIHGRFKIMRVGWGGCELGREVLMCGVLRR